ncbi:MAG: DinB family protein [Ignavibacteriae bacterium]|nr:DinB family protein [Ignavibacteriota bacterium]
MFKDNLIKIFERDLEKLISEIQLFEIEENLWIVMGDIKNSAGNLALHLCGNLKHFIGFRLGGFEYTRERDKEFSLKNISKNEIIQNINETKKIVLQTLNDFDESRFSEIYTEKISLGDVEIGHFLLHLITHLNYHLGQINYLRRFQLN